MIDRDVISRTSLVTGYVYNGSHEDALKLFCEMRLVGIDPDQILIVSVLSACAELTVLEFGQQFHAGFMKSDLELSVSVDKSLVTMYAKCGIQDIITWTALVIGYAQNGKGNDSFHAGLVEQGHEYFESMDKVYGIKPSLDHYACIIDLLGRLEKMNEAKESLNHMDEEPDAIGLEGSEN
ncbi:hypothetical protein CsSME_00024023 [Camellia sinensis var. sinensis]